MTESPDRRRLVREVESELERWTNDARIEAYADLFEGADPILTDDELRTLDAIDSAMERHGGDGVWGTDQYGVQTAGSSSSDRGIGVVCVYHPQVTADSVLRGADDLDDETEERLNAALWEYGERVATLIEDELEAYVDRRNQ